MRGRRNRGASVASSNEVNATYKNVKKYKKKEKVDRRGELSALKLMLFEYICDGRAMHKYMPKQYF